MIKASSENGTNKYTPIISVLESVYLIYMFLFFKTSMDFNFLKPGLLANNFDMFKHLLGNQEGLRICLFGRITIFALIAIIIARNFIKIPLRYINASIALSVLLSLMNMNAVIYLIPFWLIEFLLTINP